MILSSLALFEGLTAVEATVAVLLVSAVGAQGMEFAVLRIARRYVTTTDSAYDDIEIPYAKRDVTVAAADDPNSDGAGVERSAPPPATGAVPADPKVGEGD